MNELVRFAAPQYRSLLEKITQMMSADEMSNGIAYPEVTKKGVVEETQTNILFFFQRFELLLSYDEFSRKTRMYGMPSHQLLDDAAFDDIIVAMDRTGLRVSKDYLWSVLKSYSRNLARHPVREKLMDLQAGYDGTARLDTWLSDYCGVDDTPYTRAVAAAWMIAAARRVRNPGCKFDHVLIFEGEQGICKSTVFRVLGYDEWFTDNLTVGLEPQKVIEQMQGKWIGELAELTNIHKKDVESIKHFITRQVDESRLAYGREPVRVPREFVLGATTNKPRYLRDETGDRRFWMVATKGVVEVGNGLPLMLDIQGLTAVRDQLWAEAAVREAAGEPIHLSPEIEALARVEQAKRFDADERQQMLEDLLEGLCGFVPNDDLYRALGFNEKKDRHPGNAKIVVQAMSRLRWNQCRRRIGSPSEQVRGWQSPDNNELVVAFIGNRFTQVAIDDYGS